MCCKTDCCACKCRLANVALIKIRTHFFYTRVWLVMNEKMSYQKKIDDESSFVCVVSSRQGSSGLAHVGPQFFAGSSRVGGSLDRSSESRGPGNSRTTWWVDSTRNPKWNSPKNNGLSLKQSFGRICEHARLVYVKQFKFAFFRAERKKKYQSDSNLVLEYRRECQCTEALGVFCGIL